MKTKLSGSEFVAEVSNVIRQELKCAKWIESLYNVFESRGEIRTFEELAFEAKSFQRLSRLFAAGISEDTAKKKVEVEIESTFKRFSQLLEQAASGLQDKDSEQLKKEFLTSTVDSFENMRVLLADFSKVKDFYLKKRDKGGFD